jgi:outer membrane protein assembly factor BamB
MEFEGRRMYVYAASGGVVGVEAATGRVLWETDAWKIRIASVASPVVIGDGRVFLSGGYGMGSVMLKVEKEGDGLVARPLYRLEPKGFGSAQQTPILWQGRLLGVLPGDGGAAADQLVLMDLDGRRLWESGPQHEFGLGPYLLADGLVYAMDDHGRLTLAEASAEAFRPLASAEVIEHALHSWGPMAVAGGRLLLRDATRLLCLDISAQGVESK